MGTLSRKRYPRVMFGRHHDALYDFLYSQVFMEPTIPNTMWVILVGEEMLLVGGVVEIGHFGFIVDRRSDAW